MKLEIYADNLTKDDVKNNTIREMCRGIVYHNDTYLMIEEVSRHLFTLPGGGLEANETKQDCVIREVLEETGVIVSNPVHTVTITEYFPNETYISHYYQCTYESATNQQQLTVQENNIGIKVHWMNQTQVLDYLSGHESTFNYASTIQQREFLGFIHST